MTTGKWLSLGVFVTTMTVLLAALFVVFGQWRFTDSDTYSADFADVSGLKSGQFVTVSGVEVGRVTKVHIESQDTVRVTMSLYRTYQPTTATHATVRYLNLTGDRYLELNDRGAAGTPLPPNATIARTNTAPALDLDALLGSFRPLLGAIEPNQVNQFSSELVAVLQGQGGTVSSLLARTSSLTRTLADRDQVIGELITNLSTVVTEVSQQRGALGRAIDSAAELTDALAKDSQHWGAGLSAIDTAAGSLASLLTDTRAPLEATIVQLGRTATELDQDSGTITSVLSRLPDTYHALSRLGAYGNFFNYYLCGLRLKLTSSDGGDLTIPIFMQKYGRCEPK